METVETPERRERHPERPIDVRRLERALRAAIRGEVQFDRAARALYATDASNFRQIPIGVVRPRDADDVVATIEVCRRFGAPVTSRGGGTSLAGQCCNVAVILDFSRHMNRILEVDPDRRIARVEPGVVLDALRTEARKHGLTLGPDPATHNHCTIGGMIGNNSCGVHAQLAGRMSLNVHELEVVTYRGDRMRLGRYDEGELDRIAAGDDARAALFRRIRALRDANADAIREGMPHIHRHISGYNLGALLPEHGFDVAKALVGSEGTLVTILEATVRLVEWPRKTVLLVVGFEDVYTAAEHVPLVDQTGPIGLEGIDRELVEDMKRRHLHVAQVEALPSGDGWLLCEYGGDDVDQATEAANRALERIRADGRVVDSALLVSEEDQERIWKVREAGLAATARIPGRPDAWPGWEDSAVPPDRLADYLRDLRGLFQKYGYVASLYGHFGQGCVHTRIPFGLTTAEGIAAYGRFLVDAAHLCKRYGGSFSGEHGDGRQRGRLLPILFGDALYDVMREFKAIWDPDGRMNPNRVVDAAPFDTDLRVTTPQREEPRTHFAWPADDGRFSRATLRCVGVGECRRESGGTMCPSWRATHEEMHSTRGRAHLLWEMMRADGPIVDGFRSKEVRESLDLCLSCKGCKGDCPMNVDVATYKAEFLSHYYEGRVRPRQAYLLGWMAWWARVAAIAPRVANLAMTTPGVSAVVKWIANVHPDRELPRFAPQTFRSWLRRRPRPAGQGTEVLLWIDTWTNHFHPEVGQAAIEVLEAAGLVVHTLRETVCCGRPLYDHGMLDLAERQLERCLDATRDAVDRGLPIVVLEPSCASVFRDELVQRWPDRDDARALAAATRTLAEVLRERAPDFHPRPAAPVVVHGHCHAKALWGTTAERELLEAGGADVTVLSTGCCGMAGSFGYERGKYDVSVRIAEGDLLPKLRSAGGEALVLADGFSCRSQIADLSPRRGLHLAEILAGALADARGEIAPAREARRPRLVAGIAVVGVLAAGAILVASSGQAPRRGWFR